MSQATATFPSPSAGAFADGNGNGSAATAVPVEANPEEVADRLEGLTAQEVLAWTVETFSPKLYFACSFQKTSTVIAHMASEIEPAARFFYLETDLLFEETYETRDRLEERLGIEFDRYRDLTVEEQAEQYGDELWKRDPDACCGLRKVEPMRRALSSVDCWVSGVRRADGGNRAGAPKFGFDARFGLWKVNPLADWSEDDVWSYIAEHDLPYNPLHDQGYPSIGCTPCTAKVKPGEDPRAGRWAGLAKVECGIN